MPAPKISIIIPVYNADKYLRACLDSATQQSLDEIEIICINDCSTDSSGDILEEFSKVDNRLRVLNHESNRGEGAARNTGLNDAKGDYIFHLDADDTIPSNALEILYTQAHNHGSEMVKGGYDIRYEDGKAGQKIWSNPDKIIVNTNIYESRFLQRIPTSHQTYLYRRQLLEQYGIRYRTDLIVGLDLVALTTALVHAGTVTLIPDIVYHYHQSKTSITRGKLSLKILEDAIKSKKIIADLLDEQGIHAAANSYLKSWDYVISTQWQRMSQDITPEECSQIFSEFRELITNNNIVPWTAGTPHHHRYTLALVLANKDEEALSFLNTEDASNGFDTKEKLMKSLEFVLTQIPGDAGSLTELGKLARTEGDLEKALSLYDETIEHNRDNFGALIQSASILKELGRYDEAHFRINTALQILTKSLDNHDHINTVAAVKDNIVLAEKNTRKKELDATLQALDAARQELNAAHDNLNSVRGELAEIRHELDEVYKSSSWKMTEPLRKVISIVKRHK